jgi:hypothetical protein
VAPLAWNFLNTSLLVLRKSNRLLLQHRPADVEKIKKSRCREMPSKHLRTVSTGEEKRRVTLLGRSRITKQIVTSLACLEVIWSAGCIVSHPSSAAEAPLLARMDEVQIRR